MPIIKSAKKRVKQSAVRRERNLITRRTVKEGRKDLAAAIAAGNKAKVTTALRDYQSALDKAVKKNIMHKNKAARLMANASKSTTGNVEAPKVGVKKPAAKKTVAKKATVKKTVAKKAVAKKAPAKKATVKKTPAKKPAAKKAPAKKPAPKQTTKK